MELSPKESQARISEQKYREVARARLGCDADSPVQSLRDPLIGRKDRVKP
ncbi:MAG: hypothetical protein ACE14S_01965 [Candidatus Bathyarchaeia archaeon]